jgi:hypothetical protein
MCGYLTPRYRAIQILPIQRAQPPEGTREPGATIGATGDRTSLPWGGSLVCPTSGSPEYGLAPGLDVHNPETEIPEPEFAGERAWAVAQARHKAVARRISGIRSLLRRACISLRAPSNTAWDRETRRPGRWRDDRRLRLP